MKRIWICSSLLALSTWVNAAQIGPDVERKVQTGPARVLVLLHDNSDKSASDSRKIADLKALRADVIDGIADANLQMRREFALLPAFAAEVDRKALAKLAAHPAVLRIDLDSGGTGSMFDARPLAKIDPVNDLGLIGAGQTIAVIDTGIAPNHLDFTGRVVAEQCFCSSSSGGGGCCPNGSATQSGVGSAADDNGHGTNVTGIAAAGGAISMRGAAPAANIVSVKVIDRNNRFCCTSDVLAALDWVKVNHPEAKIVNASLGTSQLLSGDCDNASSLTRAGANAIQQLANNGTMVFASAGNQGNANAMSIPACLSGVVGVGAVWDRDFPTATALGCTDTNVVATTPTCFSNSSAGTDLYAPGAFITSSGRTGGQSTYAGTSQATPLVAGCASLLRAVHPNASLEQIRTALLASPTRVTDSKNGRNFPLLDCADALNKLGGSTEPNYSSIYYAPANSGYGVGITHQDQTVAAIWYTYNENGRPTWFTAAAVRQNNGRFVGPYYSSTGIALANIDGSAAALGTIARGNVDLAFTGNGQLEFNFTPDGGSVSQRILQPLPITATALNCKFTDEPRTTAANYSDLWWNPSESGWGISIQHQGDLIFLAWYTYANDLQPQWLTAVLQRGEANRFSGRLNRTSSGTPFTTTPIGDVTSFPVPEVGDASINFTNGERAQLSYTVDGVSQSKSIERLAFGTRLQVCE